MTTPERNPSWPADYTEQFLVRLHGGPSPGPRWVKEESWPLPETYTPGWWQGKGYYRKYQESTLPPQGPTEAFRYADYRWEKPE